MKLHIQGVWQTVHKFFRQLVHFMMCLLLSLLLLLLLLILLYVTVALLITEFY